MLPPLVAEMVRFSRTIPLMRILRNTVSFKSQNPCKAGTFCMDKVYIYARRDWGGFVSASLTYGPRHVQQCTQFPATFKPISWSTQTCMILNIHPKLILIFPPIIKVQTFVLVFERKKTEFLTAKQWFIWLPENQKLRCTVLKKMFLTQKNH